MNFDPSITLGALLNAAVLLVGFVVAFTRIGGRIDLLTQRVGTIEKQMEAVGKKIDASNDQEKRIGVLEERVTNHVKMLTIAQRDISDMRRGEGFIRGNRTQVDGEYS